MLNWLAGQKQMDGATDPDATGNIDPPETPAPVFAFRAFKHALIGTPQTAQPNARRHSTVENSRPKHVEQRSSRPGLHRPKSASDAPTISKPDAQFLEEPLSSPTKGILLSPGTVAARKKNVTFGEHVIDNEEKRPLKSGLPDDCPGKFPSPWNKDSEDPKKRDESPEKGRGRNRLTEALEQVRDESRKRKARGDKRERSDEEDDAVAIEHAEPRSESGKYWKRQYDVYRTNTQREVKKLITKQAAAKSFAREKDEQCTELADQLRQEQKKVEVLERQTDKLASLIKDCQDQLRKSQEADKKHREEIAMLKRQLGRKDTGLPASSHGATASNVQSSDPDLDANHERAKSLQQPLEQYKAQAVQLEAKADPVQRPSEPYNPSALSEQSLSEKNRSDARSLRARAKSKPDITEIKSTDDIWAQSFKSSSVVLARPDDDAQSSRKDVHKATSGTDATPLKTLDINTLQSISESKPSGLPQSMKAESESKSDAEQAGRKRSPREEGQRRDSATFSPSLPLPSPEPKPAPKADPLQMQDDAQQHDASSLFPVSSPFQSEIKTPPFKPGLVGPRAAPHTKPVLPNNTKENVAPIPKTSTTQQEPLVKPSAMWTSMNAPQSGKRSTSITGKDGKEVSLDRIEAARKRIAARGRVTS